MQEQRIEEWRREAFEQGKQAAEAAATWAADGNTSQEHIRCVLAGLEAGDPEAYDWLPARPDLSGVWADGCTPLSLAREIAPDELNPSIIDVLADAFEEGVTEHFEPACERELRGWLA